MFRSLLAAVTVAVVALVPVAQAGPALASSGWSVVPAPPTGHGGFVTSLSAPAATNAWAVGDAGRSAFADHWNGTSWSQVAIPSFSCTVSTACWVRLFSVSATATDAWVLGAYSPRGYGFVGHFALYWNGSAWTEVPMPLPSSSDPLFDYQINAIDAISPTNVWAVGESGDNVASYFSSGGGTPTGTLIEHYNGTSWSIVSSPATGTVPSLSGVAAVSASDVWAAGTAGGHTLTEQWNGSAWTTVTSPDPGPSDDLSSMSATSGSGIVWAAGASSNGTLASSNPLILQLTT